MRVLLVEDDDGDALIVEEELELSGAEVDLERRRTLGEAVAAGLSGFDCVLLDLEPARRRRASTRSRLREAAPDLAVLVLTGLADERRGRRGGRRGRAGLPGQGLDERGPAGARAALRGRAAAGRADRAAALDRAARGARERPARARPAARAAGHRPGPAARDALPSGPPPRAARRRLLRRRPGATTGRVHVARSATSAATARTRRRSASALRIAWRTLVLAGVPADRLLGALQDVLVVERHAAHVFATLVHGLARAGPRPGDGPARRPSAAAAARRQGPSARSTPRPPARRSASSPHAAWPAFEVALPDAWSLLLYTDGVTDGRIGAGSERLGEAGLAERRRGGGRRLPTGSRASWCGSWSSAPRTCNGGPLRRRRRAVLIARRRP